MVALPPGKPGRLWLQALLHARRFWDKVANPLSLTPLVSVPLHSQRISPYGKQESYLKLLQNTSSLRSSPSMKGTVMHLLVPGDTRIGVTWQRCFSPTVHGLAQWSTHSSERGRPSSWFHDWQPHQDHMEWAKSAPIWTRIRRRGMGKCDRQTKQQATPSMKDRKWPEDLKSVIALLPRVTQLVGGRGGIQSSVRNF